MPIDDASDSENSDSSTRGEDMQAVDEDDVKSLTQSHSSRSVSLQESEEQQNDNTAIDDSKSTSAPDMPSSEIPTENRSNPREGLDYVQDVSIQDVANTKKSRKKKKSSKSKKKTTKKEKRKSAKQDTFDMDKAIANIIAKTEVHVQSDSDESSSPDSDSEPKPRKNWKSVQKAVMTGDIAGPSQKSTLAPSKKDHWKTLGQAVKSGEVTGTTEHKHRSRSLIIPTSEDGDDNKDQIKNLAKSMKARDLLCSDSNLITSSKKSKKDHWKTLGQAVKSGELTGTTKHKHRSRSLIIPTSEDEDDNKDQIKNLAKSMKARDLSSSDSNIVRKPEKMRDKLHSSEKSKRNTSDGTKRPKHRSRSMNMDNQYSEPQSDNLDRRCQLNKIQSSRGLSRDSALDVRRSSRGVSSSLRSSNQQVTNDLRRSKSFRRPDESTNGLRRSKSFRRPDELRRSSSNDVNNLSNEGQEALRRSSRNLTNNSGDLRRSSRNLTSNDPRSSNRQGENDTRESKTSAVRANDVRRSSRNISAPDVYVGKSKEKNPNASKRGRRKTVT
jgi:hypothetical protein